MSARESYAKVSSELAEVCRACGRDLGEVRLVAVSKTVGTPEVRQAMEAGALDFGENRPDQLVEKSNAFPQARWHFIGNIQSRRIRDIVGRAVLVHSLCEESHARKIDEVAREKGIVQRVLLEVNVSGEPSKGGCTPQGAHDLLGACAALENVAVCGLMTMAPRGDEAVARETFAGLARLRDELRAGLAPAAAETFCELSMGMTEDWRPAVEEGATIVRIGRAIFA